MITKIIVIDENQFILNLNSHINKLLLKLEQKSQKLDKELH